jgi:hypothetical protein
VKAWWNFCNWNVRLWLKMDEAIDTGELLAAFEAEDGKVYRMDYTDNDGTALIEARWQSNVLDGGEPETIKKFKTLTLDVDEIAGGLDVTWSVDHDTVTGSFVAQKRGKYWYGNTTDKQSFKYNNSAGTSALGAFYTTRKKGNYIFSLPQKALGRTIQVTVESTCGLAMKLTGVEVIYETKEQLYANTEVGR